MQDFLDQLEREQLDPLTYAMARADVAGVRACLEEDPGCIGQFLHNPYAYPARSLRTRLTTGREDGASADQKLLEVWKVLHGHTPPDDQARLRVACEMATGEGWYQSGMWALDQGAKLTNKIGADLLRMAWLDPASVDAERIRKWSRSRQMKVEQWKHQLLAVLSFAGADPAFIDQVQAGIGCHFNPKLLARGVVRGAGMELIERAMGRDHTIRATAHSLSWLNAKLNGRLAQAIQDLEKSFDLAKPAYLSLLQAHALSEQTPHTPRARGGVRL